MKPNILNPAWKYTRSEQTDIRKLFARVRRELQQAKPPPAIPLRKRS
jgi:hypothetical protein